MQNSNNNLKDLLNHPCTGCSACENACSVNAISMRLNEQGFYEPYISDDSCIHCGRCLKVCPVGKKNRNGEQIKSFYGSCSSLPDLANSTSGGAFFSLAKQTLLNGGVVYGVSFNNDFTNLLFLNSDECDLTKFQKSKYIVSTPLNKYREIKQFLDSGRRVLFSGAPCQVAGLHSFLGKEYPNLLTVDFVCGGMPSLRFWQEHIINLERKYGASLCEVDFRSKKKGWGKCYLEIHFTNGKRLFKRDYLDSYYNSFFSYVSVRNSCLSCEFHNKHFSDITIADFWGYPKTMVNDVSKGLSLVFANNKKGENAVRSLDNFEINEIDNSFSQYALTTKIASSEDLIKQEEFFSLALSKGFENAAKKICPATFVRHIFKYLNLKIKRKR